MDRCVLCCGLIWRDVALFDVRLLTGREGRGEGVARYSGVMRWRKEASI